jgi:anaerobic selenocysteine-containing dehydrogenase
VALLNGILHLVLHKGWWDEAFVDAHTRGIEALLQVVDRYPPERAAEICGIEAREVEAAAEVVGHAERLVSTVLQGFYQSNQATAAACLVNDLHLVRGMIGKPGATVLQMNGQPTAQNTRETGADGDLPGFRNWSNLDHIRELADLWDVDVDTIPHWAPPTHAMQLFRYAEQGSIELLWISATNPAVSLPELHRVRDVLARPELLVVVQDLFLTETARLADVVLPAAGWGEKTGTFTNVDRTVHLSEKAVEPPGEARADLDIFLDYARRMGFRNRSGEPLIGWTDPESAFAAWQACSRGRPCDYTALSYDRLRQGGVQWPDATERLYTDGVFNTDPEQCETYGHDLATGAELGEEAYRAKELDGRAILHAVDFQEPAEATGDARPFAVTTGRSTFHFHTRTKTGRVPELQAAAPEVWVELCPADAESLGVAEGEVVRVDAGRGAVEGAVRLADIRPGTAFVPFHYGYWDQGAAGPDGGPPTAANELTRTLWDPVSKQPLFKVVAASITPTEGG